MMMMMVVVMVKVTTMLLAMATLLGGSVRPGLGSSCWVTSGLFGIFECMYLQSYFVLKVAWELAESLHLLMNQWIQHKMEKLFCVKSILAFSWYTYLSYALTSLFGVLSPFFLHLLTFSFSLLWKQLSACDKKILFTLNRNAKDQNVKTEMTNTRMTRMPDLAGSECLVFARARL